MEGYLDPVHITPEEFENATSVFLQSDQPSTLIRQENRVFFNTLLKPTEFENTVSFSLL